MRDDQPTRSGALYHLRTLGTVALVRSDGTTVLGTHGNHRRRLALLAVLAAAGERGRSRDQLHLLFWPEVTQARAQHSLDQLLYALRTSVGESMFDGTNPLHLNPSIIASDVGAFNCALERKAYDAAVASYRGPFLEGFYPSDAPEFERWADTERARLAESYAGALGSLARRASEAGDNDAAVRWWTELSDADPLSTRNAIGRIRALAAAGDRAAALRSAKRYETLVAQELALPLDPDVASLIQELRSESGVRRGLTPGAPEIARAPTAATADAPSAAQRRERLRPALIATALLSIAVLALAVWPRRGSPGALAAAPRPQTKSIAAHELYVRGSDPALMRSDSGARAALEDFRQAVALDSTYAPAFAGLARTLMRSSRPGTGSAERRRRQLMLAEQAAERAVRLDDSSADAHAALASVMRNTYDVAGAMREMTRAAALDPGNPRIHEWLAQLDVTAGRPEQALVEARRAVALDPLSPTAHAEVARALFAANRCDEALTQLRAVSSLRPPLLRAASIAAQCHARKHLWAEAIADSRRTLAGQRRGNGLLGFLLARAGRMGEARLLLDTLGADGRAGGADAYEIAAVYAGLGNKDSAGTWLARSIGDGSLDFEYMGTILDALSPDPSVDALRRRIGVQNR